MIAVLSCMEYLTKTATTRGGTDMLTGRTRKLGLWVLLALALWPLNSLAVRAQSIDSYGLSEQVRKQLVTLPYYGVFDNLEYKIQGNSVVLSGQVIRPST